MYIHRIVLICLAYAHGAHEAGLSNPMAALAQLMVESEATAAFNPSGPGLSLVLSEAWRHLDQAGPAYLHPKASRTAGRHGKHIPLTQWQRVAPVLANEAAVLEVDRAPPAPPPRVGGGGGDDGNNRDDDLILRLIEAPEQANLVEDWIARSKIYCMSDSFGSPKVAKAHSKALKVLEELRDFDITENITDRERLILGMATEGAPFKVVALASAEFSKETGLDVSHLAVAPVHLNDPIATIQFSMYACLGILSDELNTTLTIRGVTDVTLEELEAQDADDEDDDGLEVVNVPASNFEDDQQIK